MGQCCFVRFCLSTSSVVVCNAADGRANRPPGAWSIGRPTLHGGPVLLRPVRAIPCSSCSIVCSKRMVYFCQVNLDVHSQIMRPILSTTPVPLIYTSLDRWSRMFGGAEDSFISCTNRHVYSGCSVRVVARHRERLLQKC